VPLVSIVVDGYDPQEVALSLDAAYRIQVRPGLHCAPLMHRRLGTHETGGTVRFSLGPFTTADQIDTTIEAVSEIARSKMRI
jgi:selenocysteine lyase/cysteine desulfurase